MNEVIDITQDGADVRLRKGEVEEILKDVKYARVVTAYGKALANARVWFNPRWLAYSGPNLNEEAYDRMIHRILFRRLQFYASNHMRLDIPVKDFDHADTMVEVRRAVEEHFPSGSEQATALAAHLLGMSTFRYEAWAQTQPAN